MAGIYGAGVVPIYWTVNLADRQIEVYSGNDPARLPIAPRAASERIRR